MARTIFSVSAILLIIQPFIQARLLQTKPCKGATPLRGGDGRDLFCGRGPNRVTCPLGSYCDIHPTDRWAKMLPANRFEQQSKPGKCPDTSGVITHCAMLTPGCSSDRQCPGNHKCCRYGCSSKCMAPAPVIKPGKCPVRRLVICKNYRHSCSSDTTCIGTQKCCWNGCGRRCTNPAPVIKSGKCPVRRLVLCKRYYNLCSSDASCKRQQKCCWYGCGRRCINPVPKCGPICKMYCQYGFVHKNGCPICKCRENPCHFVDCLSDHQCIVVKQHAKCVPIKPVGPCPKPTGPGLCAELCGIGNKCTGGKICCSNGCGHQCMNPVRG